MTLYLDTSALVKLYVEEEGRETVQNALAQAQRAAIATIGYAECRAALARKLRESGLGVAEYRRAVRDLDRDWQELLRVMVDDDLSREAGLLAERLSLRGFDAIHLASAIRVQQRLGDVYLLAFDQKLMQAAPQHVPLYTPG
jgi:predicted nucleic acid-binding protein